METPAIASQTSLAQRARATALLTTVLFIAFAISLPAQQPITFADADLRAQTLFQQSAITGMVLVIVRNNEVFIKGYGETFPASGHTPGSASEIRLCSLSKVFAADLLTRLAAAGAVALDDPLQRYAPRRAKVPEGPGNTPITLENLATHTSGLPREVLPSPAKVPHFTFPNYAQRWAWLPNQTLKAPPGTTALYSNAGFDLLGDALASAAHKPYAQLLHENILLPLDMWDTTLFPSADQCTRLMQPASDQGPCTSTEATGASSGIYSTGADMAKFLKYLLHAPTSPAQPAAALSVYFDPAKLKSVQGLSHAGDPTGIGLAWMQLGASTSASVILEKTGGGAGFTTYIALSPTRQTGVFLAATWGKGDPQVNFFAESNNLLAALANVPPLPPKVHIARASRHVTRRQRPRLCNKGTALAGPQCVAKNRRPSAPAKP